MKIAIAALLAVAAGMSLSAQNLIQNGDFSAPKGSSSNQYGAWIHNYKIEGPQKYSYDTATFVFAPQSMKLECTGKEKNVGIVQKVDLVAWKTYKITFSCKTGKIEPENQYYGVTMNVFSGKNLWFPAKKIVGTTDWTKYECTFMSAETKKSDVICYILRSTGTAWFDDISIEEVKAVS